MTAQQLKNSILQMAVQGKLVPQDPDDEPASVLIQIIRDEKEQMIKDGKIKKEKNPSFIFRGDEGLFYEQIGNKEPVCIEDEIPFEIPRNWEWVRIGTLLSVISDGTHKTPNYVDDGIPFLSVQNISSGKLDLLKIKYIDNEEHQELTKRVCPQNGDILFCRIGTLGKALKVTWDFPFSIFVSLGLLRPIIPQITDYIVLIINSPVGEKWIQENKVGGGTHTFKINLSDIPQMLIPLPPYSEQLRIIEKVNEFSDLIEQYNDTQQKLDFQQKKFPGELKKSILQMAIQGKLVPQDPNDKPASALIERIHDEKKQLIKDGKIKRDKHESVIYRREGSFYEITDGEEQCINDEIPFEIPDNWEWVRLGNYVEKVTDQVASGSFASLRANVPSLKDPDYAIMVKTADFSNGFTRNLTYTTKGGYDFLSNSNLYGGELILSNIGASIGKCFIVPKLNYKMTLAPNAIMIRLIYEEQRDYLYYYILSPQGKRELTNITSGTATSKFSKTDLKTILIPVPPIQEQKRIVTCLNRAMELCNNLL